MEYSESIVQGGLTDKLVCQSCGSREHQLKGIIKYGFFFLECLPFFPVKKTPVIQCCQCRKVTDNASLPRALFNEFSALLFPFYRLVSKFAGVLLITLLFAYWQYGLYKEEQVSARYMTSPQVNDFYFLDFRQFGEPLRPNENYRIAKVVDVTDNMVSLVYGNLFYKYQSSLENSARSGRIGSTRYFEYKRNDFTVKQLQQMYKAGAIYAAKRPVANKLYGNFVVKNQKYGGSQVYYPGARQNVEGLAFENASYIEGNYQTALERFKLSADYGYVPGQMNLARMYLAGYHGEKDPELALYWFKQAALKSHKPAIYKYATVCKKVAGCELNAFYRELSAAGVNLSFNP